MMNLMKARAMSRRFTWYAFLFCIAVIVHDAAIAQDDVTIWKEFTATLKAGSLKPDRIHPYEQLGESFRPILMGYLDSLTLSR